MLARNRQNGIKIVEIEKLNHRRKKSIHVCICESKGTFVEMNTTEKNFEVDSDIWVIITVRGSSMLCVETVVD